MKRKKRYFFIIPILLCMLLSGTVRADAAENYRNEWVKTGKATYYYNARGRKVTGVYTINGKRYAFREDGRLVRDGWLRIDGKKYHTNEKGRIQTGFVTFSRGKKRYLKEGGIKYGWQKIKGDYYYFDLDTGFMAVKKRVDGIYLGKDGKARNTASCQLKMDALVQAEKIVESITTRSMTKEQKLQECFKWVISKPYTIRRRFNLNDPSWIVIYANDILVNTGGNCLSDAASFAYLARAVGYEEVYVCTDTGHGWTEIGGYVYDPLFAEHYTNIGRQATYFSNYYHMTYPAYILHAVTRDAI